MSFASFRKMYLEGMRIQGTGIHMIFEWEFYKSGRDHESQHYYGVI